jgi:hypothetical protein
VNATNPAILKARLPPFLDAFMRHHLDESAETWSFLLMMCTDVCFDYRTIGEDPLPDQAIRIVERLFEGGQSDRESLALLTIALRTAWRTEFDLLCCLSTFDIPFRLKLMTRILKTADDLSSEASKIAGFFFVLFKRGELHALASVVIEEPSVVY